MDREEECFNVKEKCASWADDKSIPARMYFSNVFGVAYRLGKKHAQDEQDEEMLSVPKEKVQELYDNAIKPSSIAETAVEYADALITEVSKKGGCDE